MGKRSAQRRKTQKQTSNKKIKTQWSTTSTIQQNQMFKEYYQLQLKLSKQQFQIFWQYMKIKLPVVFRVNPNCPNYHSFNQKLQSQQFLKNIVCFQEIIKQGNQLNQPIQLPKLSIIKWYPGNIVYQLNTSKQTFKKNKIFNKFHQYLQKSFDSGLVSRQQLVSMVPPLYLNLSPNDIVLDMCAAPGSKTSQMLEIMLGQGRNLTKGCIIANDCDYNRAQMLIHQIQRSGTAAIATINHPGQFLPQLYSYKINNIKQKFLFDKILCDVPCSGDGATRKIPIKWTKWHTSDGIVLHPLQLSILVKGINLLKRGGLLVYSTCSLNPIENEAVVTALMKKVNHGLQIVDIHKIYELKGRRGLLQWSVCTIADKNDKYHKQKIIEQQINEQQHQKQQIKPSKKNKYLKIYKNYQQVTNPNSKLKQTMFPLSIQKMKQYKIDNTMRILPHDQNSGGFYVALFKKNDNFQWKYKINHQKQSKLEQQPIQQQVEREDLIKIQKIIANQQQQNQQEIRQVNESDNQKQEKVQQQQQDQHIEMMQQIIEEQQEPIPQNNIKQDMQNLNNPKQKNNKLPKIPQTGGSKYDIFTNINQQQFAILQKFYGLKPQLKQLLYVRETSGTQRKVLLITQNLKKFIQTDTTNKMKIVNMGCKVFQKGKQSFAGYQCLYRLCQQGIHFISQYIQLRKIKVNLDFFKIVISAHSLVHENIQDNQIRQQIKSMTQGSFFIYIEEIINGRKVFDAMVGQNFKNSFHLMIGKEDIASLSIRYL